MPRKKKSEQILSSVINSEPKLIVFPEYIKNFLRHERVYFSKLYIFIKQINNEILYIVSGGSTSAWKQIRIVENWT